MDLYLNKFLPQRRRRVYERLSEGEISSLVYHDIFDYPLTISDLVRWYAGGSYKRKTLGTSVSKKGDYYFVEGKEGIILKRLIRQRISVRKFEVAQKAGQIIRFIPTVNFVGVTGALAMGNAQDQSDIDIMVITKRNTLWLTRLVVLGVLKLLRIPTRRFGDKDEKDKICLNMWLDEDDLIWKKGRNVYCAHEIAQVIPLINKDFIYEKFIWKNRWILNFWPNSVRIMKSKLGIRNKTTIHYSSFIIRAMEWLAFKVQYGYMRSKITREVVTPTRALFHPIDWGKVVKSQLRK